MSRGVECIEEGEMGWWGRVSLPPPLLLSFHSTPQRAADVSKERLKCRDPRQFVYRPAFSSSRSLSASSFFFFFTIFFCAFLPSSLPFLLSPSCTLYTSDPLLRSNKTEERFFREQSLRVLKLETIT